MIRAVFALGMVLLSPTAFSADMGMSMPHNLLAVFVDKFEWQGESAFKSEIEGWYGDEFSKLTFDVELEKSAGSSAERQFKLGAQRAISPFWDGYVKVRHDQEHESEQTSLGLGLTGTAPFFIHVDTGVYASQGNLLWDLELEHELPLSRNWLIHSSLEVEAIAGDESGFTEIELGVRLAYEMPSRLTTYAGVEWHRSPIEDEQDTSFVVGMSYWF